MSDSWMRTLEQFSAAVSSAAPAAPAGPQPVSQPQSIPSGDPSTIWGWIQNFAGALGERGRQNSNIPHEGAQYNPGTESYRASTEMFPGSGTGRDYRLDPVTPEEQAANRQATREFAEAALFGPERGSWVPGVDDAAKVERLARDWGLSEQELRLSAERFSEGRIAAGIGWGGIGIVAAIPFAGWAGRGIVKGGRAASRAAGKADDLSAAGRAARSQPDVDPLLKEMDDLWHSQDIQLDWLWGYGDPASEVADAGLVAASRNRYADFFDNLETVHPGLEEFATRFASSFDEVYEYRLALERAIRDGQPLPFTNELAYTLEAGIRALEVAPPTRAQAFRGMRVTPDEASVWISGAEFDLPMSSFSYMKDEVWQYMGYLRLGDEGSSVATRNVMFIMEPGATALPMGALTRTVAPLYGELATAGTFRVTNVVTKSSPEMAFRMSRPSRGGEYLEVAIEQVAPFAIEETRDGVFVRSALQADDVLTAGRAGRSSDEIFASPQVFEETGKTLYHGTPQSFERFDTSQATWRGRGQMPTRSEGYFYFSEDPVVAARFRQNVNDVSPSEWLARSDFDWEDLAEPEIFNRFREDVARNVKGRRLEIARDDYLEDWQRITPDDLRYQDILDENPIRVVSDRGQEISTTVYGREIDLRKISDLPKDLVEAMRKDRLVTDGPGGPRLASWKTHEASFANTSEWMRQNGYGKAVVNDAYESGGQSVIALQEYIGFGRPVDEVYEAAAAAGRGGSEAAGATRGSWVSDPNAEEVSVAFLRQFREQDRGRRSLGTNVDELAEQISTRGFDDALILEVDPSGRAVLIEGNHRLAAAERLGLDKVPVRVVVSSKGRLAGSGAEVSVREGLRSGNLLKPSDVFDADILGRR